jgi:hypothetical protein
MVFCCQLLLLLCPAARRYAALSPLLPLRGSSGGAGVAACGGSSGGGSGGGSGSSSGSGDGSSSGAILLLFACPP